MSKSCPLVTSRISIRCTTRKFVKVLKKCPSVHLFAFLDISEGHSTYSPLRQSYALLRPRMPFGEFAETFEKAFMTKKFDEQTQGFNAVCEALQIPAKPFIIDKLIGLWNKNRMLAKLYPETTKVLEELKKKGYKLCLVSNTDA